MNTKCMLNIKINQKARVEKQSKIMKNPYREI